MRISLSSTAMARCDRPGLGGQQMRKKKTLKLKAKWDPAKPHARHASHPKGSQSRTVFFGNGSSRGSSWRMTRVMTGVRAWTLVTPPRGPSPTPCRIHPWCGIVFILPIEPREHDRLGLCCPGWEGMAANIVGKCLTPTTPPQGPRRGFISVVSSRLVLSLSLSLSLHRPGFLASRRSLPPRPSIYHQPVVPSPSSRRSSKQRVSWVGSTSNFRYFVPCMRGEPHQATRCAAPPGASTSRVKKTPTEIP